MAASKALYRTARLTSSRCYSITARPDTLWTPDNIVISPYKDVDIPNTTVTEHLWQNIDKWADKTAVICGITDQQYTYHELFKFSHNLAANLRKKLQVSDGDSVSIMMHNSPDYTLAVLGILQSGAELTTINPIYTPHEVQRQLTVSDPKIIIGSPQTVPIIKQALILNKREKPIITVTNSNEDLPTGTISFHELVRDDHADHSVLKEVAKKSEDVSILPYSSGTTGLPKGVELTNRNIVVNCLQQDVEGAKQYHDTTSSHQDSAICILPFYHIYGLSVVMFHKLSVGAKLVTLPKFQSHTFLTALKEHKVTLCYAAPPIVLFLGSHPDVKKEHLQTLQKVMSGAGPVHNEDIKKLLARAKGSQMEFLQLYGLTETSPLVCTMTPGSTNYTTAGFALPNTEFKVIDANSKALGPNEVGELLIRGPQVMKGYRNNPEATKESITKDGWFKTGDLVTLHEDGSVTIKDRLKELIKVKGYQVPPAELENVLKEHPDVLDAGVVGIPDHRKGEVPRAFVVLKDGHKAEPDNIIEFVKGRVAEYKRIQDVVILDSLPKNPSGKLLRRVLKDKYC